MELYTLMTDLADDSRTVQFTPPRDLHPVEKVALSMAVESQLDRWPVLAEQVEQAKVREHQLTGTGSFAELVIPVSVSPVPELEHFILDQQNAYLEGGSLAYGATTLAIIENGYLACLEIASYGESWDGDLTGVQIVGRYVNSSEEEGLSP